MSTEEAATSAGLVIFSANELLRAMLPFAAVKRHWSTLVLAAALQRYMRLYQRKVRVLPP